MKILLTGGGTGGHFYPLIAVAQEIKNIVYEKKLIEAKIYYMSDSPYDTDMLLANNISFIKIPAGKMRRYFSLKNIFDPFKTVWGIFRAIYKLFIIYPDVVFSKGGYASLPALWAARLLRIPIFIHESDSHPGRTNLWSAKFAQRIALSYPEAMPYFPTEKTAVTGNPIRKEILYPVKEGAHKFLELEDNRPTILIIGGSQGAVNINNTILDILPQLVEKYQIIHQTGKANWEEVRNRSQVILAENKNVGHYKLFPYLNDLAMRMAAGASDLVITRAGSIVFEIAYWEIPSIVIPIPKSISHDQYTNAFTYARSGGAIVIEENNLTASVLLSEINRLLENPTLLNEMKIGARSFTKPNAGRVIAEEIVKIALKHES